MELVSGNFTGMSVCRLVHEQIRFWRYRNLQEDISRHTGIVFTVTRLFVRVHER